MLKVNMYDKSIHVPGSGICVTLKNAAIPTADLPPSINDLPSQEPVPLKVNIKSEPNTKGLIQAVTPTCEKPNILKLLNKYGNSTSKGEVFKAIGNRIVIPMKVSVSTKKLAEIVSNKSLKKISRSSTFQMTLSSSQFQKNSTNSAVKNNTKTLVPNCLQPRKDLFHQPITVHPSSVLNCAAKCQSNSDITLLRSKSGCESNFMTSVSCSLYPSSRSDDQDSVVSSTDSSKFSLSMSGSKFSDFDELLDEDDNLTSLSWLSGYNKELSDIIRKCNPDDPGIGMSGDETESNNLSTHKSVFLASSPIIKQNSASLQPPSDVKYNPMGKPPYSFSCLIFMAIEDSYLKRLPVKEIYVWVCKHFPYFETAPSGWKNSIRHNLSLNRCFRKAECTKDSAKGSLWCIDPAYRPNLVQALKRSPTYPYLYPSRIRQPLSLSSLGHLLPGTHSGRVPTWSPALTPTNLWADEDMTSAALNLMGLRGNENSSKSSESISHTLEEILRDAKWMVDQDNTFVNQSESHESNADELVIIRGFDQDHCYSSLPVKKKIKKEDNRCCSPDSEKSAPDAAYEFETGDLSDDDLDAEMVQDIMNEIVIDGEEKYIDESLFDSGFGSMKDYVVETEKKTNGKSKVGLAKKQRSSKKRRSSKTASDIPAKKSRHPKQNSTKLPTKPQTNKRRSERVEKHPSRPSLAAKPKTKVKVKNANSDIDSGNDSPKVLRSSRSRRFQQRSYRKENVSNYHTRSSSHRLLGQDSKKDVNRRKRLVSSQGETTDEEEEIKRAAGSLLRLAGLLKSPTTLSRTSIK